MGVRRFAAGFFALGLAATASVAIAATASKTPPQKPTKVSATTSKTPELNADGTVPDSVAKMGVETQIATVWDCNLPQNPPPVSARADHGTVAIKKGTGPACGKPSLTANLLFYTSEPGFKGTDKVYMLGFSGSGPLDKTFSILVR
jgi:hypothetical protein